MAQRNNAETELRVAEDPAVENRDEELQGFHFPEPLIVLAKRKLFILAFVGASAAVALVASLLWPKTFTANAKVMPPQQNQSMSATAMLSQLGPLASLAGQGLGLRNTSDIYVAMLHSRTVADALIDRFLLMDVYGAKRRVDARDRLDERTVVSSGKDGVISISVDDRDPQLAANLANAYVDELEKLTRSLAFTEAGKRRVFFEREMKMASDDLANAEVALKQTQEKTHLVLPEGQSRALIESLTALQNQIAAKEVQVRGMRLYATPGNPDLIRAEQELVALRDQEAKLEVGHGKESIGDISIGNVPSAGLEYIRKLREVRYREALFELLAKQFEAAKIDEARDALIVQQLDKAVPPEKRSWPKPTIIVLFTTIVATLIAVLAALLMENVERAQGDPRFAARLHLFKVYLHTDRKP
jgi:uncharacterized protein involved in exopolysaccharide biosynthesis